jgi:hypothetical protein
LVRRSVEELRLQVQEEEKEMREPSMRKYLWTLALCVSCSLAIGAVDRPASIGLAGAIIGYAQMVSTYRDFVQVLSGPTSSRFVEDWKALSAALDTLPCDVNTRLAFTHRWYTVQPDLVGQRVGLPAAIGEAQRTGQAAEEDILFVAAPLPGNPDAVLAVLSSASPSRLSIFTIDSQHRATLIYDSLNKPRVPGVDTPLGSMYQVAVERDRLVLYEAVALGGRFAQAPDKRTFAVDLNTLQVKQIKQPRPRR